MESNLETKDQVVVKSEDREVTDKWGAITFFATIFVLACIGLDGYINGNTTKLTAPYDGAGNFCGVGDFKDYDYLLFDFEEIDPFVPPSPTVAFNKTLCVKKCPEKYEIGGEDDIYVDCKTNHLIDDCPTKRFLSTPVMKICVPKTKYDLPPSLAHYRQLIKEIYVSSKISGFLNDLEPCFYIIIFSVFINVINCLIYYELVRLFAM